VASSIRVRMARRSASRQRPPSARTEGQWAALLVEAAAVDRGHRVLDVACGTGIVARTAADRVGPTGSVVGLDLNEAMLIVAKRVRPDLEWRQGDAADLPFEEGSFDAALCQMALMFFPDRAQALAEMARVVTADGVVAICVPAGLEDQPAYGALDAALGEVAGPEAQELMTTYWSCGDLEYLRGLFASAGLTVTSTRTPVGTVRYPSIDDAVATEWRAPHSASASPLRPTMPSGSAPANSFGTTSLITARSAFPWPVTWWWRADR